LGNAARTAMSQKPSTFAEAMQSTQRRLEETLGQGCTIDTHLALTPDLIKTILYVDSQKFREELQYKHEEVQFHGSLRGFFLILAHCGERPLGLAYGYEEGENGFFLDTLASVLESKGIGSILATLMIIYAHETKHNHITLYTEERDEKGRRLRRFYEQIGFKFLGSEEGKGDVMRMQLDQEKIANLYTKHIVQRPGKK
jgi:GNAT superfamily N-acetyltransferase